MSDQVTRSRYADAGSPRYLWHLQQLRRKKRARKRDMFQQLVEAEGKDVIGADDNRVKVKA